MIKTFAPELSDLDDTADVQPSIDQAERRTNRIQWGVKADDGVTYLVCHMLTIKKQIAKAGAQAKGALTSQTVGPVSRSFSVAAPPFTDQWFASTEYGKAFVELRSTIVPDRIGCL